MPAMALFACMQLVLNSKTFDLKTSNFYLIESVKQELFYISKGFTFPAFPLMSDDDASTDSGYEYPEDDPVSESDAELGSLPAASNLSRQETTPMNLEQVVDLPISHIFSALSWFARIVVAPLFSGSMANTVMPLNLIRVSYAT
jgi:hypothetical protein